MCAIFFCDRIKIIITFTSKHKMTFLKHERQLINTQIFFLVIITL